MTDHVTDVARHAGRVRRYHAWPTIQNQTIGEHSWGVALIYEQIFGELSPPVERFIRLHDVAELVVGDPPFPVKMENPDLKREYDKVEVKALERMHVEALPELDPDTKRRIKVCDLLEMMVFGMTERELGNMLAVPIINRTEAAAMKIAELLHRDEFIAVRKFVQEAEARHNHVLDQDL